uniref:Uncharacterized protein n=1 Tax=Acrobeloides nanus TaxID=290746 RepID=A0A914CL03_9BILA
MNFSRNSLPTTPAATTSGSQANNTPFGNAVLLNENMITPSMPQEQQLPAAISNSVADFRHFIQNVMPTTPTQSNNVGQSAEELFRWWIAQQTASGALIVGTSTNTPVTQNQTSTTVSVAASSPMVSNTNVVTVGMSPRANGISPRTNMPAMQSPILHSLVAMNQDQLKSLQAQQQQAQQKPSQPPVRQMPNLTIGALTPFVNAFNKFYDIFNCDLIDPIGNIVAKDEFPKTCLKEIFTDSKISEALIRRGYQLAPEDYQTLDYVFKINCFDECFAIFLRIYFKTIKK